MPEPTLDQPAPTTDLGDRLRALAAWCDRHGVTVGTAVSATAGWDSLRVHVDLPTFWRLVGLEKHTRSALAGAHHLRAVVDGVNLTAIEPIEVLPPGPGEVTGG